MEDDFLKADWHKNWSGDYAVLSCTYDGYILTKVMRKYFGIAFDRCIIISRDNQSTGYFVKDEIAKVGKYSANKIVKTKNLASRWIKEFKRLADDILVAIERSREIGINKKDYTKISEDFFAYASYHTMMKVVLDYLPQDLLEKYLPIFNEVRIYTEKVYPIFEQFRKDYMNVLSRETGLSINVCCGLTKDELGDDATKLPAENILEERIKSSALLFNKGKYKIVNGQEVAEIESNIIGSSSGNLTGLSAYAGRVTGRVRIVLDPKIESKFKEGEILVTEMTRPEYIYLVKKSAAIVTDAGGILSHAAIISRELKIPCVVGTKFATKVLKDGYLVEVDASKGTVRILEK